MTLRLAYTISGQPRFVRECAQSHRNVINNFVNEGWQVDVYLQSWLNTEHTKRPQNRPLSGQRVGDTEQFDKPTVTKMLQEEFGKYRPTVTVLDYHQWSMQRRNAFDHIGIDTRHQESWSIHPQIYAHSINAQAIQDTFIEYDIVIKARYDCAILNPKQIVRGPNHGYSAMSTRTDEVDPFIPDMLVERIGAYGLPSIRDLVIIGNHRAMVTNYSPNTVEYAQRQLWDNETIRRQVTGGKLRATAGWYIPQIFSEHAAQVRQWPHQHDGVYQLYRRWHADHNWDINQNKEAWSKFELEMVENEKYKADNI